ncbi:ribokinase [Peribacillus frigoritolerans]|uniref:ribokinase n=1 Tax=Peribacillus frigoritolerans TaxID=450367 RepID=UPI003DA086D4
MKGVVVVGSINMDIVAVTNQYPAHGETIFGENMKLLSGGKGANQATTCAKLGKPVKLIGAVGDDAFGHEIERSLLQNNVNISSLKHVAEHPTGCAVITVDATAENTMLVIKGANEHLTGSDIDICFSTISDDYAVLLVQMEIPNEAVLQAMKRAKEKNMFIILDPAPAEGVTTEALTYANLITPNWQETKVLTGIDVNSKESACKAGVFFKNHFGVENSIIKLGHKGALVYQNGETNFIEPIAVNAVDTVGAGDSFAGALACAIADGETIESAAEFASIVAAMKVTKMGAQDGVPRLAEVEHFCETNNINYYGKKQKLNQIYD